MTRVARLLGLGLLMATPVRALEPPADAVLADLPFAGDEPNRVIVDLAPTDSGRPFPLFLDTGAQDSVLTPRLARQLGVGVRRHKSTPYRRPTVLGRDLQFWVDDRSSDTGSKTGWEYGLLGGRFLAEYVVEIDFAARRVRFLDRRRYSVPESVDGPEEAVLPMRVVANRPLAQLEVEGRSVSVLLDTGAPNTLVVSGSALRKADVSFEPIARLAGGGVLGPIELLLAEASEVRIGPFGFGPAFPLLVAPKGLYNQATSTDSVVGYDLLAQFVVRFDYPRRRLWLRRVEGATVTLFGADYASARREGVLLSGDPPRAYLVFPESPAEHLGLRAGDVFAAAEGDPPGAEGMLQALAEGGPMRVHRRVGDAWQEVVLGAEQGLPSVGVEPD